jgi:NAD(P)-dependent dehydrogenase (short-subunit alcohol dehydrogenase family)
MITFKEKNVLVTGGTGLVGRELVELLVKEGAKVKVQSITTRRNKGLNTKVKSRVRIYKNPREMTV